MANLNKVLLMGNLTRDVELGYLPNGTPAAKLGMAVNRTWVGQDGQKHEEVNFIDLKMLGKRAEVLNKYLHKGDPLFIEGRLRLETWDDKQTGQKRSKMVVVIEDFQFMPRGGGNRDGAPAGSAPAAQRRPAAAPQQQPAAPAADEGPPADDYAADVQPSEPEGDHIPF